MRDEMNSGHRVGSMPPMGIPDEVGNYDYDLAELAGHELWC